MSVLDKQPRSTLALVASGSLALLIFVGGWLFNVAHAQIEATDEKAEMAQALSIQNERDIAFMRSEFKEFYGTYKVDQKELAVQLRSIDRALRTNSTS